MFNKKPTVTNHSLKTYYFVKIDGKKIRIVNYEKARAIFEALTEAQPTDLDYFSDRGYNNYFYYEKGELEITMGKESVDIYENENAAKVASKEKKTNE